MDKKEAKERIDELNRLTAYYAKNSFLLMILVRNSFFILESVITMFPILTKFI